jgi:hypothetical protein
MLAVAQIDYIRHEVNQKGETHANVVLKSISPKDADYQSAKDFVTQHFDGTLKRIENYWEMIWQEKSTMTSWLTEIGFEE